MHIFIYTYRGTVKFGRRPEHSSKYLPNTFTNRTNTFTNTFYEHFYWRRSAALGLRAGIAMMSYRCS